MNYRNLTWLLLSVAIIIIDQVSKYYIVANLAFNQPFVIIPHFFNFCLSHNTGSAFGFLSQMPGWQRWFLVIVAIVICAILLKWLLDLASNQIWLLTAISLVIGGAIGNLIDRVRLAYVVDFIQLYYKNFYYPTFNLADSAVVIGAIMIGWHYLFREKKHEQ